MKQRNVGAIEILNEYSLVTLLKVICFLSLFKGQKKKINKNNHRSNERWNGLVTITNGFQSDKKHRSRQLLFFLEFHLNQPSLGHR